MRQDYYADYFEFEQNNWWFVSRREILRAILRKFLPDTDKKCSILDAGCGTGINLQFLAEFGDVSGVDASPEAIGFCHQRGETSVKQARIEELPCDDNTHDLVTALDVLEHIEDDGKALSEMVRVCKPGGYLLITVPGFPSLWGEHDVINQHVRRYEWSRLLQMLEDHNCRVVHRSCMNTWLLPVAFLYRWYHKIRRGLFPPKDQTARADNMHHHPLMNRILTGVFTSELPFVITTGLPVGLSLVILAQKPE